MAEGCRHVQRERAWLLKFDYTRPGPASPNAPGPIELVVRRTWVGPLPLRAIVQEWWSGRQWYYRAVIRLGSFRVWTCRHTHATPRLAWLCCLRSHNTLRAWLRQGHYPA